MRRHCPIIAAVGLAALLAATASAQTPSASDTNAAANATVPAGSLQRIQNAWRGRTLLGAPVFNDGGQRIATITDLLIADDGRVDKVVLAVTQPRRLVAVPFGQFRLVPSQSVGTPFGRRAQRLNQIATEAVRPYGVMLPGASRDTLAAMESFRFASPP
jgi:hypothetical protein